MKINYLLVFAVCILLVGVSNLEAEEFNPNLAFIGRYDSDDYAANAVAISGDYAYIAYGNAGLVIVNIEDSTNPTAVASIFTSDAYNVAISGNYAYVADYYNGLVIVNIENPTNPTWVGTYDTGNAYDVAISGNYTYVADSYGLVVVNTEDPTNPTFVESYEMGGAQNIVISGNYAYVTDYYNGLFIFNIENPGNLTMTRNYYLTSAKGLAISGNLAYVTDYNEGLIIINIEDPANPSWVGFYEEGWNRRFIDVTISGDYAYIADYYYGLTILDIKDPGNPTLFDIIGNYGSSSEMSAQGIAISGNQAYLIDRYSGLIILSTDSDNDGFADLIDTFPRNPDEHKDTDGDGMGDNEDFFPENPRFKTFTGVLTLTFVITITGIGLCYLGMMTFNDYVVVRKIAKRKRQLNQNIEYSKHLGINAGKLEEIMKVIESSKDEVEEEPLSTIELPDPGEGILLGEVVEAEPESVKDGVDEDAFKRPEAVVSEDNVEAVVAEPAEEVVEVEESEHSKDEN